MSRDELSQAIYNKYIVPTQRPAQDHIGVEFEFPIVNLSGDAVDFDVVHAVTQKFLAEFGFVPAAVDD